MSNIADPKKSAVGRTSKTAFTFILTAIFIVAGFYLFRQSMFRAKYNARPEKIPIGAILPLSGNPARIGQFIQRAFDMGIYKVNENGGVAGHKLEVLYEDDKADPQVTKKAMRRLAGNRNIPVIFGSWASSCVLLGQKDVALEEKIPVLAMAQSPQIKGLPYICRIQPSSELYIQALVPYAVNMLHLKKFHIVNVKNDYGNDLARLFAEECKKKKAEVLSVESYDNGTADFHAVITRLKANSDVETGVFLASYTEAGDFLRQAAELQYTPQFLGASPMENPDIVKRAGKAAEGVIYAHHYDPEPSASPSSKKMTDFIEAYRSRFGEDPDGYAALGYDAAFMLQKVLQEAARGTEWPEREAVKDKLYDVKDFAGVTGSYSMDQQHDVKMPIYIRKIENGRFKTVYRPVGE